MTEDPKPRSGKAPLWLLPAKPLRAIASAFLDGIAPGKYTPHSYMDRSRKDHREVYGSALYRHILSYLDPECPDYCNMSGVHHLAHAGANVMILLWHEGVDFHKPLWMDDQ